VLICTESHLLVDGRLQRAEGDQPTVYVTGLQALEGTRGAAAPDSHDFH
jgi:hypothetical protein